MSSFALPNLQSVGTPIGQPVGNPTGTVNPVTSAITSVANSAVTNLGAGLSWGRIGAFILGLLLIFGGIGLLIGEDVFGVVTKAGKAVAEA